jgi:hypothetical protein
MRPFMPMMPMVWEDVEDVEIMVVCSMVCLWLSEDHPTDFFRFSQVNFGIFFKGFCSTKKRVWERTWV